MHCIDLLQMSHTLTSSYSGVHMQHSPTFLSYALIKNMQSNVLHNETKADPNPVTHHTIN